MNEGESATDLESDIQFKLLTHTNDTQYNMHKILLDVPHFH